MLARVTAKNVGDFFLRQCTLQLAVAAPHCDNAMQMHCLYFQKLTDFEFVSIN